MILLAILVLAQQSTSSVDPNALLWVIVIGLTSVGSNIATIVVAFRRKGRAASMTDLARVEANVKELANRIDQDIVGEHQRIDSLIRLTSELKGEVSGLIKVVERLANNAINQTGPVVVHSLPPQEPHDLVPPPAKPKRGGRRKG